ncbi:MAG: hypothetical protein M3463_18390 [Verrucomicrobiota bacterium]|nr:hypothetical protein [Verrucomicrobiota bacterium]
MALPPSRLARTLTAAGILAASAHSEPLPGERIREGEVKQQQLQQDGLQLVAQLEWMLDEYKRNGLGGVKLFVQDAALTGAESRQARRVAVVVCSKSSSAWKKFESLATAADLGQEKWPRELHVRSVIMAKMDGAPDS